jgi:hypothetical protein
MLLSKLKDSWSLDLFTIFMIILPEGVGFRFIAEFQIWVALSLALLLPIFLRITFTEKILLEKTDIIILFLVVMSSFFYYFDSGNVSVMIGFIVKNFLTMFLPYYICKTAVKTEKDLIGYFIVLNVGAILVLFMASREYTSGVSYFQDSTLMLDPTNEWRNSQILYIRFGQIRVAASFLQPLYLGTFLGFVSIINLLLLTETTLNSQKILRFVLMLLIPMTLVGILLTQSRTVLVAIAFIFIIATMTHKNIISQMINFWILGAIAVTLIVAFFIFGDYINDFIRYNVTSEESGSNWFGRVETAVNSMEYLVTYFNWFGEAVATVPTFRWFYENNDLLAGFINPFLRNGFFFFILYNYLWYIAFKKAMKNRNNNLWTSLFFILIIYYIVVNMITALNVQNSILFYMTVGFIFNPILTQKKPQEINERSTT